MANMIEQSLLCKVLDAPDLEILHSNGVVEEMFLTCKDEIHFIIEHYNSYKQMPDKLTFLGRFKDFQMLEVTESTDYLVYKLKEAYTYTKLVPLIEDTAKVVKEDSIKAIQYLKEEIEKLEKSVPVSRNKDGYDIISNAGDRLTEYKKRCEVKGLIGIPTGIPKDSIRKMAREFCISKSQLHRDLHELRNIDDDLYVQCRNILRRHRRSGGKVR